MKNEDIKSIKKQINQIEKDILKYPSGSISKKTINGKERFYHQWYELGKTKSKYLKEDEAERLKHDIEIRKTMQKKLKTLKEKLQSIAGKEEYKSIFRTELKAELSFPMEITGLFNGKYIIPDKKISPVKGQKVLVTIRDIPAKTSDINLDKYINQGERLFKTDAQKYIRKLRDEERM